LISPFLPKVVIRIDKIIIYNYSTIINQNIEKNVKYFLYSTGIMKKATNGDFWGDYYEKD